MERRTNSDIIRQKKKHFLSGKLRKENLAPNLIVQRHLHRSVNFICVADKRTRGRGLFNFLQENKRILVQRGILSEGKMALRQETHPWLILACHFCLHNITHVQLMSNATRRLAEGNRPLQILIKSNIFWGVRHLATHIRAIGSLQFSEPLVQTSPKYCTTNLDFFF